MYLRNNKDPQFKTGVFSSQWFLKHSVCSNLLHVQTTKMEGEQTAKNVQKGARFKIQRENEARMLVRLMPPDRGKMRASVT